MLKLLRNIAKACFPEYYERKRIRLLNAIIGPDAVIYKSGIISNTNKKEAVKIGAGSHIAGMLVNCDKGKISIGERSFIGEDSRIYAVLNVTIGDNVQIAHNVNIYDSNIHSLNPKKRQQEFIVNTTQGFTQINDWREQEVIINDNVWIGAGSFIMKGVSIGENTIIGAGSVVLKSLPPNVMAAGNPAKIIKPLGQEDQNQTTD